MRVLLGSGRGEVQVAFLAACLTLGIVLGLISSSIYGSSSIHLRRGSETEHLHGGFDVQMGVVEAVILYLSVSSTIVKMKVNLGNAKFDCFGAHIYTR